MERQDVDVKALLRAVQRRWKSCLAIVAGCVLASVVITALLPRTYEADAHVLLRRSSGEDEGATPETRMATDVAIAHSPPVAQRAIDALGLADSATEFLATYSTEPVTVDVLGFTTEAETAEEAQRRADVLVEEYLAYRREQVDARVASAAAALQPRIDTLSGTIAALNGQIAARAAQLPVTSTSAIGDDPQIQALSQERDTLGTELTELQGELTRVQVDEELAVEGTRAVAPAELPEAPSTPKPMINYLLGLFVGLALGVGFVVVTDLLSGRLARRRDFALAATAPVVAELVVKGGKPLRPKSRKARRLLARPSSDVNRAVGTIANELRLAPGERSSVLFASVGCHGETALLVGTLASRLAAAGSPALIGDFTEGHSPVRELFGAAGQLDVSSGLGEVGADGARVEWFEPKLADRAPAGTPTEFLVVSPLRARSYITEGGADGRGEAAPLLAMVALNGRNGLLPAAADHCSRSVLVARAGVPSRDAIRRYADLLAHFGMPVTSVVLVGADEHDETSGFLPAMVPSRPELSRG